MLSDEFMCDLLSGFLNSLLKHVRADNTLMIAIREGYINIYYRGGNLLKLSETKAHEYSAAFDKKYASSQPLSLPDSPNQVTTEAEIQQWIESFPIRKQIMDFWLTNTKQNVEREFQQLVVRENNFSPISNNTEYFIVDIELVASEIGARFDMLAFKWPSTSRRTDNVGLALIEMKYGDNSLTGPSGIVDHLSHLHVFLSDPVFRENLRNMAEIQINQLNKLGLMTHAKTENRNFCIVNDRYEVIFLFSNHNPRSQILLNELKNEEFSALAKKLNEYCDIRFFMGTSAGYGMHETCMFELSEHIDFLEKLCEKHKKLRIGSHHRSPL